MQFTSQGRLYGVTVLVSVEVACIIFVMLAAVSSISTPAIDYGCLGLTLCSAIGFMMYLTDYFLPNREILRSSAVKLYCLLKKDVITMARVLPPENRQGSMIIQIKRYRHGCSIRLIDDTTDSIYDLQMGLCPDSSTTFISIDELFDGEDTKEAAIPHNTPVTIADLKRLQSLLHESEAYTVE